MVIAPIGKVLEEKPVVDFYTPWAPHIPNTESGIRLCPFYGQVLSFFFRRPALKIGAILNSFSPEYIQGLISHKSIQNRKLLLAFTTSRQPFI